jgi:uncharacterized RDD family membrane protein YckC
VPAPENLSIDTPEQIALEFPLAGVGSRFLALAFDSVVQAGALIVVFLTAAFVRWIAVVSVPSLTTWVLAALVLAIFVLYTGYFAVFESIWSGQTPGKRMVGLRVIDVSGRPVTVYAAIIRNLIRIVDQVPGIYAVAIFSVLITRRQQRLGDLAAGTVVVHERSEAFAPSAPELASAVRHGAHKLGPGDVMLIEEFLRRRHDLDSWVRRDAARRIAEKMAGKLGVRIVDDEEQLLEHLAAEYRSADRYR